MKPVENRCRICRKPSAKEVHPGCSSRLDRRFEQTMDRMEEVAKLAEDGKMPMEKIVPDPHKAVQIVKMAAILLAGTEPMPSVPLMPPPPQEPK